MSYLARGLAFLSGLIIAAAAGAFIWMLWNRPLLEFGDPTFRFSGEIVASESSKWIATGVAGLLLFYACSTLVAAVWPNRKRFIELRAGDHESVRIAPATLEHQLADVVREAGQVRDARVEARRSGDRSVALDVEVAIPPHVEVAAVVADVQRRLATALATQYGISMAQKPRIQVRYLDREPQRRHRGFMRQHEREPREQEVQPGQ